MENENHTMPLGMTRRRALGLMAISGLGFLASSTGAEAAVQYLVRRGGSVQLPEQVKIADAWRRQFGPIVFEYREFLTRLRLRNIKVHDIIEAHAKQRGTVSNSLPPKSLWRNIASTLRVLDQLSHRLGQPPSEIVSVYRSPAYNARCYGAKRNSLHMRNMAIDVRYDLSPRRVVSVAKDLRASGAFQGGIGRYPSFTHIDTRGKNADW